MEIKRFGDSSLIIEFGKEISRELNEQVMSFFRHFEKKHPKWITDLIPAYNSLTLVYKPDLITFEELTNKVRKVRFKKMNSRSKVVKIPVCYDMGIDKEIFCHFSGLSWKEIVDLHTKDLYLIYMMGFLPGFLYMGEVSEKIRLPRKEEPRKRIEAGSVGIAGTQTGIYPVTSPGGWNILGRTPIRLFDPLGEIPFPMEVGESVQFYSITRQEFHAIANDKHYKVERIDVGQ